MITLHAGEEILLTQRRHWLPVTLELASFAVLGILPALLISGSFSLSYSQRLVLAGYIPSALFIYASWLMLLWIGAAIAWTNHHLDVLFVTNKRILDVDQLGLFSRDLAEIRIENVQDVHVEIKGFIPSMFNYGNLAIQSAGEQNEFKVINFHDPHGIREAIAKAHEASLRTPAKNEVLPNISSVVE